MICPNIHIKEVKDGFNEMVEAFGGRPLTDEEFKSSELRSQRTGLDYAAMEAAYRSYHRNNGNMLDKAPNGKDSVLFNSLLKYFGNRAEAIKAKSNVYTDEFFNWFGNWTAEDKENVSKVVDENEEPLVVWHGTNDYFEVFDSSKNKKSYKGFFFSSSSINASTYGKILMPVYLNIVDTYNVNANGNFWNNLSISSKLISKNLYDEIRIHQNIMLDLLKKGSISKDVYDYWNNKYYKYLEYYNKTNNNFLGKIKRFFFDFKLKSFDSNGSVLTNTREIERFLEQLKDDVNIIFENIKDYGSIYAKHNFDAHDVYVVTNKNRIKHIENLGEFSPENDNIYHNKGLSNNERQIQRNIANSIKEYIESSYEANHWHDYSKETKAEKRKEFIKYAKERAPFIRITFGYDKLKKKLIAYTNNKDNEDLNLFLKVLGLDKDTKYNLSEDHIEDVLNFLISLTKGALYNILDIVKVLKVALKGRSIKFKLTSDLPYDQAAYYDEAEDTIYINDRAAFKNQFGFSNQLTLTVLHELLHSVTVHSIKHSSELQKLLLDLLNEVKKQLGPYTSDYGLTDIYEFLAELSNKDFIDKLSKIRTDTNKKQYLPENGILHRLTEIIRQAINRVLRKVNRDSRGTAYADAVELLMKSVFPKGYNIDTSGPAIDIKNKFMLSSADAIRKSAEDIRNRFGVLYKAYEKMPNKSPRRQRQANEIFELYNNLKLIDNFDAVLNALSFAKRKLGLNDDSDTRQGVRQWLEQNETDNFARVSAEQIVDLMQNTIGFFDNLITYFPDNSYMTLEAIDMRKDVVDGINKIIKPLWAKAVYVIGDRVVDELVDRWFTGQDEDAEGMKEVAKDWLHKNSMYGDISSMAAFLLNYQYSNNPITKQVFHLILVADTKTGMELLPISARISKAYLKANREHGKLNPAWLKIFMEFDKDGIPTGNFVRDINYGQYLKDVDDFVKDLNERFLKKHGHFYYVDESGSYINSVTGGLADDEEWINGVLPAIIEYKLEIEKFKCERANRRYTFEYYKERMSEPYTGPDPALRNIGSNFKHGLSPRTLSKYQRVLSNINYYMSLCYDKKTGVSHPEDLSDDDWIKLELFRNELQTLSNPYNEDGSTKSGEDYQTAIEIRAWEKWIGLKLDTKVDIDSFNQEARKILLEKGQLAYDKFIKYNSTVGINPNFISQTIKKYGVSDLYAEAIHAKLLRTSLQKLVNSKEGYTREFAKLYNNPQFWQECKRTDQIIEDNRTKQGRDFAEMMEHNFSNDFIPYRDMYGNAYNRLGLIVPRDKEGETNLLTWFDYMINSYTSDIMSSPTRTKNGLFDLNGNPILFNGTADQVKEQVRILFTYIHYYEDEDGNMVMERRPLSIFSLLTPLKDTFVNESTGRIENTITNVPNGRFQTKVDTTHRYLTDPSEYDYNSLISEQPKREFYDNSEAFSKVKGSAKELYDILVDVCRETLSIYKLNQSQFNYRLPMINAQSMALLSRLKSDGFANVARSLFDAVTTVEENDENMRTAEQFATNPDGTVCTDIPLKFIRPLKDMRRLSTDISSMVVLFAEMGLNFKNKLKIDSAVKALRYNMDYSNREMQKTDDDVKPREGKNATEQFDNMTNIHLYGNDWHFKTNKDEPYGRGVIAAQKISKFIQRYETKHMLGLNILSMLVGACDAGVKLIREVINGKYARPADLVKGLVRCIIHTPLAIANIGCPLANNKFTALMQLFRISKGTRATFEHMNWGRLHKIGAQFLMGGFSMLDYMMNGLLLMSHMSNVRLYNEDGHDHDIKPGFYTLYELQQAFIKAGRKKSEATFKHLMLHTDLFNAFEFSSDEGCCYIKDKYKQYVTDDIVTLIRTKTLSRGALYNGMNPDNDLPEARKRVWSAITLAMRGWLTQAYQHLMSGGTDNIPIRRIKEDTFNIRYGKTHKSTEYKKQALTNEQRSRRLSWNYETGTPLDLIFVGLFRAIGTGWKYLISNAFRSIPEGDPKKIKFSNVEKYAVKDAIVYIASMALMMVGWMFMNDSAGDVPPPDEDDPKFLTNPYSYIKDVYLPNQYWKLQISDIYFRTIESSISSVDPTTALDFITSLTVLKSGFDEQVGIYKVGADLTGLSGHDFDEVLNRGGYKGYTRWQRALAKGSGFLDNIHTFFDFYGLDSNLNFYTGKYGGIYKLFGYDYKRDYGKSLKKGKSSKSSTPSFGEPKFKGGPSFGGGPTF